MRIITGKLKGMNLFSPQNMDIRPTADRIKESVFNILGNSFYDATVLDLFAGSGNLGLEAWSRGAQNIHFVDQSRQSLQLLGRNLEKAKVQELVNVHKGDAINIIKKIFIQGIKFDYIFCDPPYNKGYVSKVLYNIEQYDILTDNGIIIVEHNKEEVVDLSGLNKLELLRVEKYGDTFISFFKKAFRSDLFAQSNLPR